MARLEDADADANDEVSERVHCMRWRRAIEDAMAASSRGESVGDRGRREDGGWSSRTRAVADGCCKRLPQLCHLSTCYGILRKAGQRTNQ